MEPNIEKPANNMKNLWVWLTISPGRMTGIILLVSALVLLLALIVLVSKKPANKNVPQPVPSSGNTVNNIEENFPTPQSSPKDTSNWKNFISGNGFSFRYPSEATVSGSPQQVSMGGSTMGVESFGKGMGQSGDPLLTLERVVELAREKNASSSAKILTKPISILFAGNKGYEWYLESSKFYGNRTYFTSKQGKNRVIQFEKGETSYIIFTTSDEGGEQLLSTFRLNP